MKRKNLKIIILITCLSVLGNYAYCQLENKKDHPVKKSKFDKKVFEKRDDVRNAPVGPPTGEGPISSGLSFLLIGSTIFILNKVRNEKK